MNEDEIQVAVIPAVVSKHEYPGNIEGQGESGEGESGGEGSEGGGNA